jgi:hypothetical protein
MHVAADVYRLGTGQTRAALVAAAGLQCGSSAWSTTALTTDP